tara:strand:- start:15 stop:1121 length:1107 start_codon:yes stop_codon:yes gene_type:complete
MRRLLLVSFFAFAISAGVISDESVSDERISEISQRLETYNTDKLIERRDFLVSYQEGDEEDSNGVPAGSASERAIEISIIEALLVAIGAIMLDNVTEDSSTPPDTVFPVITILGDNPATVELGSTYTDAGATSDGGETVSSSGSVDTSTLGTYTITYSATDAAGNTSTATRTVNVVDTTPPVITITGDNPATVELGGTYIDAGATATDLDTVSVTQAPINVDPFVLGTYTVTYTATDASGNTATATRTVNVVDTTAPVITSSDTFVADENQTAIGTVTATDLQTVIFTVSGTELQITSGGVLTFVTAPDYETKSVYTATVTATDASSNSTTQDITVNVNDVGGIDDDPGTGTGTSTSTGTGTGTGTGT